MSSVSHDPSEIILICWLRAQETFIITDKCFDEYKQKLLFEVDIFCNILNVFTVTFDQFNASLLNKSLHFFQKQNKKSY